MIHMVRRPNHRALTLLEAVIAMALIAVLLSVLLPALSNARSHTFKDRCHENQRRIGQGWQTYLNDHDQRFPDLRNQPGWKYGGVSFFSNLNDAAYPDWRRPLTPYLGVFRSNDTREIVWCCPADSGISGPKSSIGTGRRSAFRSYGTSHRANGALLRSPINSTQSDEQTLNNQTVEPGDEFQGLRRTDITTAPSRLVLGGDAVWYEVAESTGLLADWHNVPQAGNLLFLDGSVRFVQVKPKHVVGPVVFNPRMPGSTPLVHEPDD